MAEVDDAGQVTTLDSWSDQTTSYYVAPRVAAAGDRVYYTMAARNRISRISLSDPDRQVENITAGSGGDIRVDPRQPAGEVKLDTPRGLAVDADGALYVSCFRRHIVYRLLPGADGTVGPDSVVERVLGTGSGSGAAKMGSVDVGVRFGINQPLDLALSPEGYLFASNTEGVAVYDPASEQARWFTLNAQAGLNVDIDKNGSIVALDRDAVFGWDASTDQGILLTLDGLSSEHEPTRRIRDTTAGLALTDTEEETLETYTWTDETKSRARLSARHA